MEENALQTGSTKQTLESHRKYRCGKMKQGLAAMAMKRKTFISYSENESTVACGFELDLKSVSEYKKTQQIINLLMMIFKGLRERRKV